MDSGMVEIVVVFPSFVSVVVADTEVLGFLAVR